MLGEPHPTHVKAVVTTLVAATRLGGASIERSIPIFFVQARGDFVCRVMLRRWSRSARPVPQTQPRRGRPACTRFHAYRSAAKLRSLGRVYQAVGLPGSELRQRKRRCVDRTVGRFAWALVLTAGTAAVVGFANAHVATGFPLTAVAIAGVVALVGLWGVLAPVFHWWPFHT